MAKGNYMPPDGRLRLSQLVSTHGPGAMLDLVHSAVLVSGLDHWKYQTAPATYEIDLPRLRDRVQRYFGSKVELQREAPFRTSPPGNERDPALANGVPAFEFPSWFVCQNRKCRALCRASELDLKGGRRRHRCEDGKSSVTVPVRFVQACPAGHLDDFRWRAFVHMGKPEQCAAGLTLHEGRTGDFSELEVHCGCGAKQKLMTAYDVDVPCNGARPWLGRDAKEPCAHPMRLLIRTASHSYFPQVVSALAIPEVGNELRDKLDKVWDAAKNIASPSDIAPAKKFIDKLRLALEGYTDDEVWKGIQAIREKANVEREPLRTAEFKKLRGEATEKVGDLPPPPGEDYFARRIDVAGGLPEGIEEVVLAHRLRTVSVLVGFTRLEAPTADLQGEYAESIKPAPLTLHRRWLPANESRGEGIFVQLDAAALLAWEARPQVKAREACLRAGYEAWRRKKSPEAPEFLGVRYYLLHSLSHLLISAMALECGYSASSLQERIYCSAPDDEFVMAGILISTGSAGSEGSLGGLVEQGRVLGKHLARALDAGKLCSNDPVCAHHNPETDLTERHREGAACHGCLFIAEPSCERFNQYLDRALVVPTMGHEHVAFFGTEG